MSINVTLQTAFRLWAQLDCPTSLRLKLLVEAGDWAEAIAVKVSPEHFSCPIEFGKAAAAVSFLSKLRVKLGAGGPDKAAAAMRTWFEGEASCYRTNERLVPYIVSPLSDDAPAEFLRRVRKRLLGWLRHAPDDDELKARARHGPGTTFSSSVANPTAADKYSDKMSLTSGAVVHLLNLAGTKWMQIHTSHSPDRGFEFLRGNRHCLVPKTGLTDRSIAIEPTVNIYFQLAVGNAMRARLRKYAHWDIDNAAPIHREMARRGSIDGSFATIDLSNASDTLCKNLVRVLLRDTSWLPLLEDLRSPRTRVDGKWHLLEKFSSMGNGYTFELETCIFAALAAESMAYLGIEPVLGVNLFVFGDDIIVPSEAYEAVSAALTFGGFTLNPRKSFNKGYFRESCGGDFFFGVPVRGFYLKEPLVPGNARLPFTLHNGLRRVFSDLRIRYDSTPLWEWILAMVPVRLRLGGPPRLGDIVLHGYPERYRWKDGIRWLKTAQFSEPILVRWAHFSEEARLACRLTGYGESHGISCRGLRSVSNVTWVSDS